MRFKFLAVLALGALVSACAGTTDGGAGAGAGAGTSASTSASTGASTGGIMMGSQEDLVVNVGDRVFFDYDKYNLGADARRTLERQAAWLKTNAGVAVTVEGHADERGTREYNLALGERRANAVKDYLVALGISPNRVNTISYGKERPVALGSNEAAWAQNRRGVTTVN